MIISDKVLSQKLERAEATANAAFVDSRARQSPAVGACWIDVGGTLAMFDGPESPCTQTFGLGLFSDIFEADLNAIEEFFLSRQAPVFHEVSPMAEGHLGLLPARGYQPIELTTVLMTNLADHSQLASPGSQIQTHVISPDERELWAATSSAGWSADHPEMGEFMLDFGRVSVGCEGGYPFIAGLDGNAIATAMLFLKGEVAVLAGASTVPNGRNHGAQSALLAAWLEFAKKAGCSFAAMAAAPEASPRATLRRMDSRSRTHVPSGN